MQERTSTERCCSPRRQRACSVLDDVGFDLATIVGRVQPAHLDLDHASIALDLRSVLTCCGRFQAAETAVAADDIVSFTGARHIGESGPADSSSPRSRRRAAAIAERRSADRRARQ
jgi:hypothetical protein